MDLVVGLVVDLMVGFLGLAMYLLPRWLLLLPKPAPALPRSSFLNAIISMDGWCSVELRKIGVGMVIVGMDTVRTYLHKADKVVHTFSYLVGLCNTEVVRFYLVPPKYISTYLHVSR